MSKKTEESKGINGVFSQIKSIDKNFSSDPIKTRNPRTILESISSKIHSLGDRDDLEVKSKTISEIADAIYTMPQSDLAILMPHSNEFVRHYAARAYVDKNPSNLLDVLKIMLLDKNEFMREAAVIALCYMNSSENLDILKNAAQDSSEIIRLKALTGIADIALEYSSKEAVEILKEHSNDPDEEIREFVKDELSFLN